MSSTKVAGVPHLAALSKALCKSVQGSCSGCGGDERGERDGFVVMVSFVWAQQLPCYTGEKRAV